MGPVNERNENKHAAFVTTINAIFSLYMGLLFLKTDNVDSRKFEILISRFGETTQGLITLAAFIFATCFWFFLCLVIIKFLELVFGKIVSYYQLKITKRALYAYCGYFFYLVYFIAFLSSLF